VEGIREIETLSSRVFWLVAVFNLEVTKLCNPRNCQIAQRSHTQQAVQLREPLRGRIARLPRSDHKSRALGRQRTSDLITELTVRPQELGTCNQDRRSKQDCR
jgi:hypothetical protein